MRKIFITSFPFDEKNSGDYDYCTAISAAINNQGRLFQAEYLTTTIFNTSQQLTAYKNSKEELEKEVGNFKNTGGNNFYNTLSNFYNQNSERQQVVEYIENYMASNGQENAIFNLQIRAPETGFLFSPQDLSEIKNKGFKIFVTCHEYELNSNRPWLQTILHPYFIAADQVLFFSAQDRQSAINHANYSTFSDRILKQLQSSPTIEEQKLLLELHTTNSLPIFNFLDHTLSSAIVRDQELITLNCKMLIGTISCKKGKELRYSVNNEITQIKAQKDDINIELEWGIRENLIIPFNQTIPVSSFKVSGIIIEPEAITKQALNETPISDKETKYLFNHQGYDLLSKSALTRVPPTTACINNDIEKNLKKPANIIIFGLLRNNKGFEDALAIINEIHYSYKQLPNTRLKIVGKVESYGLLANILIKKFGISKKIDGEFSLELLTTLLEDIDPNYTKREKPHDLKNQISKMKFKILKTKLKQKVQINNDNFEAEQLSTKNIINNNVYTLQNFVDELSNDIPEILPIDIYLNKDKEQLPSIFAEAKYAIKYDDKGWANNASGLINLLAYGTILYTGWGMCTDNNIIDKNSKYSEAIVFPRFQYGIKSGETLSPDELAGVKREHFEGYGSKVEVKHKRALIRAEDIINDIITRENNQSNSENINDGDNALLSSGNNKMSFENSASLLSDLFDPGVIAGELIDYFSNELI